MERCSNSHDEPGVPSRAKLFAVVIDQQTNVARYCCQKVPSRQVTGDQVITTPVIKDPCRSDLANFEVAECV